MLATPPCQETRCLPETIDWLLAGPHPVRWQVLRDLTDASDDEVQAEQVKATEQGLVPELLNAQRPDGTWGGIAWNPGFDSTMHALSLLREFGALPEHTTVQRALERVCANVTWNGCGPPECAQNRFFEEKPKPASTVNSLRRRVPRL
ncbi:MAG: hypothetical protein R3F17_08935 [Planctomycetota bacterium]